MCEAKNDDDRILLAVDEFLDVHLDDFLAADKCKQLIAELERAKAQLIAKVSFSEAQSIVRTVCDGIEDEVNAIDAVIQPAETLAQTVEAELIGIRECRQKVQAYCESMLRAQVRIQYTKVLSCIDKLNAEMQNEYQCHDDKEKCATIFANLCEISRNLSDTKATHLFVHLRNVISHWHQVLKAKFAAEFNGTLKTIKWPLDVDVNVVMKMTMPLKALQITTEYLLQIEMPEEHRQAQHADAAFATLCLPIFYMVQPLYKRFLYHFTGDRQTNRIDKPEWYFTRILSWVRDHIDLIENVIQPVIDKLGLHHIDAKVEFMYGLVQMTMEKLEHEIPNFRYDDVTFSHTIDEALAFEKELRETYFYPASQPSVLHVLTKGSIFNQWLRMEKKYALEKMDGIFNHMDIAFELLAAEDDQHKITKCADTFITLLQTITSRYEALIQPGHRLQFLDLQIELLDNFRIRLLQLANVSNEADIMEGMLTSIVNTSFHIENVLLDWGTMLHYLSLFYYKHCADVNADLVATEFEDGSQDTVFAETISLYRHMRRDLLSALVGAVVQEAQQRSRRYCSGERWSSMVYHKDFRELSLTPTACPMFEVLARRLHQLQKYLAAKLFTLAWRDIAAKVDVFLFDDVVLCNRFNSGGAMQFKFDIQRNLFPLFAQFCEKPGNAFGHLKDSCALLNITKGSALLLRETLVALEGATGVEDRRGMALREIGVMHCTPHTSIEILNRRTDITVNRMSTID